MQLAIEILALAALLVVAQECLRHFGRHAFWLIFLVLPVLLTPHWIQGESTEILRRYAVSIAFPWIKLYSLCFCGCWAAALRFSRLGDRVWFRFGISVILAFNILLAVAIDLLAIETHRLVMAAAGILVTLTIPYPLRRGALEIDRSNSRHDICWNDMTRLWIVGYTIWNWSFMYINFPFLGAQHLAVLLSALLVAMLRPALWLQARTYTLAAWLMLAFTFPTFVSSRMGALHWSSEFGEQVAAWGSLIYMMAFAVWHWRPRLQEWAEKTLFAWLRTRYAR